MEKLKKNKPLVGALFLLVLAILYLLGANTIHIYKGAGASSVGSAFYPRVLGWLLLGLCSIQVFTVLKQMKAKTVEENEEASENLPNYITILLTIVSTGVYIALLEPIGFLIMSALYVFALILILSPKKKRKLVFAALLSLTSSIIIYFLFVKGFSLVLPSGILG
ncbi:MAG: tripartite tricarboxylate transporter TctB family protein [Sphaerochaeta sp.]|nr:tripartite tricarboxylate transporter TctB family protein [Sphaerochaeta sp.]